LNHKESDKKEIFTTGRTSRPSLDDFFDFEEVLLDGQVGFAVYYSYSDSNTDRWEFHPYYGEEIDGGIKFIPKSEDEIPWLLPGYPTEYVSEVCLYAEIRGFIYAHLDLSFEWQYDVLTSWVLAQWRGEEWASCPYISVIGPKNSGKSRVEEVLHQLSYRGIFSPSMSIATLFHAIEKDHVSVFFDEAEFLIDSKEKNELLSIINNGYRKGGKVYRFNLDRNTYEFYDVYSFKVFASTRILAETLENRSIIIYMQRNSRPIRLRIDTDKAAELRGKLLLYRFRHLQTANTSTSSDAIDAYLERLARDNRLIEIFSPLMKVTENMPEQKRIIEAFMITAKTRETEEQLSLEASIVEAILKSKDTIENGKLSIGTITETFNAERSEKEKWRTDSIGRQIKKLGFESCRTLAGKRGILWNEALFHKLQQRFLCPIQNASKAVEAVEASKPEGQLETKPCSSLDDGTIILRHIHPGERCELCGKYAVEYEFEFDGHLIRRCDPCIQMLRSKGFKFTILQENDSEPAYIEVT
jgi:hypothetical protein